MKNKLFIFGGFAHDPQGILTSVRQLALVGVKRGLDRLFRFGFELGVTALTNAGYRRVRSYNSQLAPRHCFILAQVRHGAERP